MVAWIRMVIVQVVNNVRFWIYFKNQILMEHSSRDLAWRTEKVVYLMLWNTAKLPLQDPLKSSDAWSVASRGPLANSQASLEIDFSWRQFPSSRPHFLASSASNDWLIWRLGKKSIEFLVLPTMVPKIHSNFRISYQSSWNLYWKHVLVQLLPLPNTFVLSPQSLILRLIFLHYNFHLKVWSSENTESATDRATIHWNEDCNKV